MKFSNFALAAVAIAASSAHAFSTPKFAVHQVRIDSTTDDKDIVEWSNPIHLDKVDLQ